MSSRLEDVWRRAEAVPSLFPDPQPNAGDRFAAWAEEKEEKATTRKAMYGLIVVLAHRYFSDIKRYPQDKETLHSAFERSFDRLQERLLELDPLLPDGRTDQVVPPQQSPQAAGVFYQDQETVLF